MVFFLQLQIQCPVLLGFEGSAKSTAEIKARAIGRKRNGFGKALGDVLISATFGPLLVGFSYLAQCPRHVERGSSVAG